LPKPEDDQGPVLPKPEDDSTQGQSIALEPFPEVEEPIAKHPLKSQPEFFYVDKPGAVGQPGARRLQDPGGVGHLTYSLDGSVLIGIQGISSKSHGGIGWDARTGEPIYTFNTWALSVSPDRRFLLNRVGHESQIRDIGTGKIIHICELQMADRDMAIRHQPAFPDVSPDQATVMRVRSTERVIGHDRRRRDMPIHTYDGEISLWSATTGKGRWLLRLRSEAVGRAVISPDCKILAATTDVTRRTFWIRLWDLTTGKQLHVWQSRQGEHPSLRFLPDGKTLLSMHGHQGFVLWDLASGEQVFEISAPIIASAISSDCNVIVCREEKAGLRIYDLGTRKPISALVLQDAKDGNFNDATFSGDGKAIITVGYDHMVRVWDTATGKQRYFIDLKPSRTHVGLAASPDGKTFAFGDGIRIRLWDLAANRELLGDPR
jgi:WD40 repeat protein